MFLAQPWAGGCISAHNMKLRASYFHLEFFEYFFLCNKILHGMNALHEKIALHQI